MKWSKIVVLSAVSAGLLAFTACDRHKDPGENLGGKFEEFFADNLADDLEQLGQSIEDIATSAQNVPDNQRRSTLEECYDTFGDCDFCYSFSGNPLIGTFSAGPSSTPCGADRSISNFTATYEVTASSLTGDYAGTLAGDYTIEFEGDHSAALTTDSANDSREYDSSWTLESLSASTVGGALDEYELELTYTGFADMEWGVEVSGDTTSITGTVSGEEHSCTVSGSFESIDASCE
ncbi:MAG: hypothetical protein HN348_34925 [Proteobacteria bacterium]|nr:hypothetical protein [Pseudomonadota bacterium]